MNKVNLDTYCGIYCGACSVLMHGKTGCTDGLTACLGSIPKEAIACGGCKSDTLYAGCRICSFRDCALEKGIAHCIDCADYPCKMHSKWQSAGMLLPHIREAAPSLKAIKRDSIDTWIATQIKRWSCPDCGESFSWYAQECHKCGRKLVSEAYEMSGWRKLVAHFVLPMIYRKGNAKRSSGALS